MSAFVTSSLNYSEISVNWAPSAHSIHLLEKSLLKESLDFSIHQLICFKDNFSVLQSCSLRLFCLRAVSERAEIIVAREREFSWDFKIEISFLLFSWPPYGLTSAASVLWFDLHMDVNLGFGIVYCYINLYVCYSN